MLHTLLTIYIAGIIICLIEEILFFIIEYYYGNNISLKTLLFAFITLFVSPFSTIAWGILLYLSKDITIIFGKK